MSDAPGANRQERTLQVAERVAGLLEQQGVPSAVIGAIVLNRPALSHWHPDWKDAFAAYLRGKN